MSVELNFYFGWFFYNLIITTLFFSYNKGIVYNQRNKYIRLYITSFFILAVCGNAITSDYWSYYEIIKETVTTKDPFVHIESFYKWWIPLVGNNYLLYRLVLYSVCFIVFYYLTKYLEINKLPLFLLVFVIVRLFGAIGGRQFFFDVVYYSGILLLIKRKFILAILILAVSFFLHKSAYIALPVLLLSLFRFRNIHFVSFIICFPILCYLGSNIVDFYLEEFIDLDFGGGKYYLTKTEGIHDSGNIWWHIISGYQRCVCYMFSGIILYSLFGKIVNYKDCIMYNLLFWYTYLSLFILSLDLPDSSFSIRVFNLSIISMCYLFTVLIDSLKFNQAYRVLFFLICLVYQILNNAFIVGCRNINL